MQRIDELLPIILDRRTGEVGREAGRKGAGGREEGSLLVETGERFLCLGQIAGCNVDVTNEFVDVFWDDLELDGHVGEPFTIGVAILNRELIYCSELEEYIVRLVGAS